MKTDPRINVIDKRFRNVDRVLAIAAGKGGVGKSSVSSMLALELSRRGHRVGLMDLDIHGPSDHVVLGVDGARPTEKKGILPPEVNGIKFMSMTFYSGDRPSPIRGRGISNSIIELLAITRWGDLDFLILDLPPGFGEATLDVIRLIKKSEFIIVYTPSVLVTETVEKLVRMLRERDTPITGVIENMKTGYSGVEKEMISMSGVPFLGSIRFDRRFEKFLGHPEKLLETGFAEDLSGIMEAIEGKK